MAPACASTGGLGPAAAQTLADEAAHVAVAGRSEQEVRASSRAAIPAGRYGSPEEFGTLGAFLGGAGASYLTGTALRCDGGVHGGL